MTQKHIRSLTNFSSYELTKQSCRDSQVLNTLVGWGLCLDCRPVHQYMNLRFIYKAMNSPIIFVECANPMEVSRGVFKATALHRGVAKGRPKGGRAPTAGGSDHEPLHLDPHPLSHTACARK